MHYWSQEQYFATGSLRPFLHTWSLSIEAQFYLLFPLLVFFSNKNRSLQKGIFLASLISFLAVNTLSPNSAFFLLPFRLWEFSAGLLLSIYFTPNKYKLTKTRQLIVIGLAILVFISFELLNIPQGNPLPNILAVIFTLFFIREFTNYEEPSGLFMKVMQLIGDRSYIIYLVHFPLLILLNYQPFHGNILGIDSLQKCLIYLFSLFVISEIIHKKIYVTDFGKEIVQAAEKILAEVNDINYKMHAYKGELSGKLKLSVVSTGKYIAPYFLTDFMKQHQGIELILDVTNKAQVLKSLENNEVDFSLVSVLPENILIEKEELLQNKLFVVGNREMKYAQKPYNKKILEDMPFINREQGSGTRHVMEKFIKKNNLPVKMKMELTGNEAVKQAVIAGLGNSIMPLIGIKNELENEQLQIIQVKGFPIKSKWYLIWLKEKKLTPLAHAFLKYLRKEKQTIISEKFDWFERY